MINGVKELIKPNADWYKNIWSLDIKNMSWVEETEQQIDFIVKTLELRGNERILDLACGFGRHSIAFEQRGYSVVGVDITYSYIEDAINTAKNENLKTEFICSDIRDINYCEEFDIVLSLADGAIGYLENDAENLKIFDRIAAALKPGGKHFMDVCSGDHAAMCFPKRHWEVGTKMLSLADFGWDSENKRMLFSSHEIPFGEVAIAPPPLKPHSSIRLYRKSELEAIFRERGMNIVSAYSDYLGTPASEKHLQLMVYSRKI